MLSAEWVAQRIVSGLRRDETVIECDMKFVDEKKDDG